MSTDTDNPDDVAVVPRWVAPDGYLEPTDRDWSVLADLCWCMPEGQAAADPEVLEVAAYTLVFRTSPLELFVYRRGEAGGEDGLHEKLSFGVGGNVERQDFQEDRPLWAASEREVFEELKFPLDSFRDPTPPTLHSPQALLYTDEDDVSAGHLAVVSVCEVEGAEVREEGKLERPGKFSHWHRIEPGDSPRLVANRLGIGGEYSPDQPDFETWSRTLWPRLSDLLPMGDTQEADQAQAATRPERGNGYAPAHERLDGAISEVIKSVGSAADKVERHHSRLDKLHGAINQLRRDRDEDRDKIAGLRERVDELEGAVEHISARADRALSKVASINENRLTPHDLMDPQDWADRVESKFRDLEDRLDALEDDGGDQ